MNYYIYKTTNLINGKIYVGQRQCLCNPDVDKYIGSGTIFTNAVKKYGKENFKKEILQVCSNKLLDEKEIFWIAYYGSKNKEIGYNLTDGGKAVRGYKFSKESKLSMSKARKGKISSFKGKKHTKESKLKSSLSKKGKPSKFKGKKHKPESIEKFRESSCLRTYAILCPNGTIEYSNNLKEFCKKYSLDFGALLSTYRGIDSNGHRRFHHKKYLLLLIKEKSEFFNEEEIVKRLKYIDGIDKKLPPKTEECLRKYKQSRTGTKLSETIVENIRERSLKFTYGVRLPSGLVEYTNNLKEFCREHKLDNGNLMNTLRGYNCSGGKVSQYKKYIVISKEPIVKTA